MSQKQFFLTLSVAITSGLLGGALSIWFLMPQSVLAQGGPQKVIEASKQIVGEWFIVAENPRIKGQVVLDFIHYDFRPDGKVTRIVEASINSPRDVASGTYRSPESGVWIATVNRGEAGIQEFHFRLGRSRDGLAKLFYWRNRTLGFQHEDDDLYVKKGSKQWEQRRKVEVSP